MADVYAKLEKAIGGLDESGKDLVRRALELARIAHAGQTRDEGGEYLVHPVRVALILIDELKVTDPEEIAAALCHDVLEDSQIAAGELGRRTTARVAEMVAALTKDPIASGLAGEARVAAKTARDNRYYGLIGKADAAIRRVKSADRLDNLRHADKSPEEGKAKRYATESRVHMLPIAKATDPKLYEELRQVIDKLAPQ